MAETKANGGVGVNLHFGGQFFPIDERGILTAEVFQQDRACANGQRGMVARDRRIRQRNVAGRCVAHEVDIFFQRKGRVRLVRQGDFEDKRRWIQASPPSS